MPQILAALRRHHLRRPAIADALPSDTHHQHRRADAAYRARGRPSGRGTLECGGTQLSTARRKQAGLIWSLAGARAVAAVRTWRKRGRWREALARRPVPHRT